MDKLIFWEMNEINFNYVNFYINNGKLPNWKKFIENHGLFKTNSIKNTPKSIETELESIETG